LTTPVAVATPVVPNPTTAAIKPAATKKPTVPAVTPTATALPLKFAAPVLIEPLWNDDRKDERKYPSGALTFKWRGQTGMSGDECYLLTVTFSAWNPPGPAPKQDSFLWGCNGKTTINSLDGSADPPFTLYRPTFGGPNYTSLLIDASEIRVDWTVTLVKNLGQCVDDFHCKTVPLSPPGMGHFLLRGS
jgi:hypothetical protein